MKARVNENSMCARNSLVPTMRLISTTAFVVQRSLGDMSTDKLPSGLNVYLSVTNGPNSIKRLMIVSRKQKSVWENIRESLDILNIYWLTLRSSKMRIFCCLGKTMRVSNN